MGLALCSANFSSFRVLEIITNETGRRPVFIYEGRHTVTERALNQNALLMTATNEDALESAVREHARLVYRIAYSVSRNHHDAEDATQETFMRVLRYRRKLEGVDDPKTWIARIAWRVAVEQAKKRPSVSLSEKEIAYVASQLRSQGKSADEIAASNQMASVLQSLIEALPESLRDAMRLSTIEQLASGEIAEVLGTSEASVRSRLFRARQILKEKLLAMEGSHGTAR
jgi:RNA polymerase sigma-70 factor, ECF subfamily